MYYETIYIYIYILGICYVMIGVIYIWGVMACRHHMILIILALVIVEREIFALGLIIRLKWP